MINETDTAVIRVREKTRRLPSNEYIIPLCMPLVLEIKPAIVN